MAKLEILMPNMGESIFECTVLKWLIKEGDFVQIDDMILEVATDKIDTEIGATSSGIVTKFLVKEGDTAFIGKPICEIDTNGTAKVPNDEIMEINEIAEILDADINSLKNEIENQSFKFSSGKFYSPLVLNIAKTEGISQLELEKITGTGLDKRVTKDDVLKFLENRSSKSPKIENATFTDSGQDRIVEMDRMRKMISERMVESKKIAPHVTSFIETDMTDVVKWRDKIKSNFKKKHSENFTFTPILIKAVAETIKEFPGINIQVDGVNIIYKNDINIGMAVALPNGNLIVPVIHRADIYNLTDLAIKVNDLANRARNNQLKPEELTGGTYTITNIGSFGNLSGTPIILQPQVAIMAFGVIRKLPSVIETSDGDFIGIRQKMIISHSYDHRVVDGSLGGLFLKSVSDKLENYNLQSEI
jgi:2-oxoglutarate dehydrogenase E2 component (dihydrolipoamide succinyltransferase)